MARNPRRLDTDLDALYAELPKIDCQGLCSDSCGPIEMSVRERQRIEGEHGEVTCGMGASCSMLDAQRRCRAYATRPMICRLWGLTKKMRCHYGCVPERWLSDAEVFRFIARADSIGGAPHDRAERLEQSIEHQIRTRPELIAKLAREIIKPPTLADRARLISPPGIVNDRTQVQPRRGTR